MYPLKYIINYIVIIKIWFLTKITFIYFLVVSFEVRVRNPGTFFDMPKCMWVQY